MILDFSAHSKWDTCPAAWWESYINRRRRRWSKGLRGDALALGSLVHEGLRVWQETHTVEIPEGVREEMTPTQECLSLAEELVFGYTRTYPEERWPLILCEEPVLFPLQEQVTWESGAGPVHGGPLTGLAKIDSYFYVPEATEIETGIPGLMYTLSPGWWIHEYKTKSPFIPMAMYMQGWEMGMQASYQLLALRAKQAGDPTLMPGEVQGILVNVLEKPRRYIPKRKCRRCEEQVEYAMWIAAGGGQFACPLCGHRQELSPLKQATPTQPPAYYRIIVTRSAEELAAAQREIIQVGEAMLAMEAGGLHSHPWHHAACVDTKWNRACDYFAPHKNGYDTRDSDEFETPADYRGLIQLEVV